MNCPAPAGPAGENSAGEELEDPDIPGAYPDDKLPQTGQLWWPVPALLCAGLVLILAGVIRRRGTGDEK